MSDNQYVLWSLVEPYGPYICKRPNWKQCPEHAHLTDKRPSVKVNVDVLVDIDGSIETQAGEVSLNDYNSYDEVNVNVKPASTTFTDNAYVNRVYRINGVDISAANLEEMGHTNERVKSLFNRPTAGDGNVPNKEQIEARLEFAVLEAKLYNIAQEMVDRKFRFPTYKNRDERKTFYLNKMRDANNAHERLQEAYKKIVHLEQPARNTNKYVDFNFGANQLEEVKFYSAAGAAYANLRRSYMEMEKDDKFRFTLIGMQPKEIWRSND